MWKPTPPPNVGNSGGDWNGVAARSSSKSEVRVMTRKYTAEQKEAHNERRRERRKLNLKCIGHQLNQRVSGLTPDDPGESDAPERRKIETAIVKGSEQLLARLREHHSCAQ
jgi:hypothetical protein